MSALDGAERIAAYMASDRSGPLYLGGCTGLTVLPDGMNVGGYLYLGDCTDLTALPNGQTVAGGLYLSGCTCLTVLPRGLAIGRGLYLGDCTSLSGLVAVGSDSRGHEFVGVPIDGKMHVSAGCRFFSLNRALHHWRDNPECLALVHKIAAHAELQVAA